jgi:hypothetical protein
MVIYFLIQKILKDELDKIKHELEEDWDDE